MADVSAFLCISITKIKLSDDALRLLDDLEIDLDTSEFEVELVTHIADDTGLVLTKPREHIMRAGVRLTYGPITVPLMVNDM